jgi:hypothetical protein
MPRALAMANEDVEVAYRARPVWPRALIFACAIFAVIGAFWAIVSLVRTYVEPPRVGGPQRMTLAAREMQPVPPAPMPLAVAPEPAPAVATLASPAPEPPTDPIMPYQVTALDQPPPVEESPSASGLVASRWLPMPTGTASPTTPPSEQPKAPEPAAMHSMPASENTIAGPVPIPRPKPRVATSTAAADPPLPRPRPNGSAPASLLTPIPSDDDRFGTQ